MRKARSLLVPSCFKTCIFLQHLDWGLASSLTSSARTIAGAVSGRFRGRRGRKGDVADVESGASTYFSAHLQLFFFFRLHTTESQWDDRHVRPEHVLAGLVSCVLNWFRSALVGWFLTVVPLGKRHHGAMEAWNRSNTASVAPMAHGPGVRVTQTVFGHDHFWSPHGRDSVSWGLQFPLSLAVCSTIKSKIELVL